MKGFVNKTPLTGRADETKREEKNFKNQLVIFFLLTLSNVGKDPGAIHLLARTRGTSNKLHFSVTKSEHLKLREKVNFFRKHFMFFQTAVSLGKED